MEKGNFTLEDTWDSEKTEIYPKKTKIASKGAGNSSRS